METAHFGLIESNSNFAPKTSACNSSHDHKNLCMLQHAAHSCSPSSNICITEVLFCYLKHRSHSVNVDGPVVQVLLEICRVGGRTTRPGGRISKQHDWESRRHWKRWPGQWGGSHGCTCKSLCCSCSIEVERSAILTDWISKEVCVYCVQQSISWCSNSVRFGAHLQEHNNWEAEKTTILRDLLHLKMPRKVKEQKKCKSLIQVHYNLFVPVVLVFVVFSRSLFSFQQSGRPRGRPRKHPPRDGARTSQPNTEEDEETATPPCPH
jgi:hypothetical protein